ncbi:hypothetical protein U8607_04720 [Methylobacterium durans]|jgi:hypothetical protein|nr:hypothetical protein [Methylobacterium durans]MEA1831380.1 hypothetical protein [Methylobacterium durans]
MDAKWMTLPEIALERRITLREAEELVAQRKCPTVFKTDTTLYLI